MPWIVSQERFVETLPALRASSETKIQILVILTKSKNLGLVEALTEHFSW